MVVKSFLSYIISSLKYYWEIIIESDQLIIIIAAMITITAGIITIMIALFKLLGFIMHFFIRKKIYKMCEVVRNDLDKVESNIPFLLISRKILDQMYPDVKRKYIDLCWQELKKNGDIFTDKNYQDWYKKRG